MRKLTVFLSVILLALLSGPDVFGQVAPTAASSEGWQMRLTPYLWGSGFEGRVGIGDRTADVDASFGDIFRELNFGFMGTFEASRNRFIALGDVMYLNLSDKHGTPGPLYSDVDGIQKSLIFEPAAGYRVAGSDAAFIDVLGGIRFWRAKGELKFQSGVLPEIEVIRSRSWVDGVFALRGKARLSDRWHVSGYGDIGGGGSNLTYQILGVAGAEVGKRYALVFGYRDLNVAYNKDQFLFDAGMRGPIFGFTIKF